jgi:toxin ParE1/3/4
MRGVYVEAEADQELNEAAAWYELRSPGAGARLLDAFENALTVLREEPVPLVAVPGEAGALGARRLLLHRFPFDVIVVTENDEFVVIAVAHHSRRPGYWMGRLRT